MTPAAATVVRMYSSARAALSNAPRDATMNPSVGAAMRLHADDNVLVARKAITAGTTVEGVTVRDDVRAGHKFSARVIGLGGPIVEHGAVIGHAATALDAGVRLDGDSVAPLPSRGDYRFGESTQAPGLLPAGQRAQFQGFVRENGDVGTRNYLVVLCTVNCSATTSRSIANHFTAKRLAAFPNVDGVIPLVHELGCGMEMSGEPMELLRRSIAGQVRNANVGAALIVSLGCERNHIPGLLAQEKLAVGSTLKTFVMQETGGTRKTIEAGIAAIEAMLPIVNQVQRQPVSAEHLKVGLQCAGTEGFTGLSANPALGIAADLLVKNGATVVLSRTSDVFGALPLITARAATPEVGQQLVDRVDWWLEYSLGRDTPINRHRDLAGQAKDALTAVEDAVGYCQIAGTSPLNQVVNYAHPITGKGLVFMDTPSDDAMSVTGQMAGGATLICMTTGGASTSGSLPAPTIKLAANTPLYERMEDDFDVNCGLVIDGEVALKQMGQAIFEHILRHASGEKTKSEDLGAGENEFVPWPIGVTS